MKAFITLVALGSTALAFANPYNQPYGNTNGSYPSSSDNSSRYYEGRIDRDDDNDDDDRDDNDDNDQKNRPSNGRQTQEARYSQNNQRNQPNRNNISYTSQTAERTVSDEELHKKIQDSIGSGWFSKGFPNVSFDVRNGDVTLSGSVDTLEQKNDVEGKIRKIEGVRQVNNGISVVSEQGKKPYSDSQLQDSEKKFPHDTAASPTDRQVNARIRDKLNNGWFSKNYEALVIRTNNGIVVITGNVEAFEDIQKIIDQIQDIEGVRSIHPQVNVKNRS